MQQLSLGARLYIAGVAVVALTLAIFSVFLLPRDRVD